MSEGTDLPLVSTARGRVAWARCDAGFIAGYWMHSEDGHSGASVELFDSLAYAQAEMGRRSTDMAPEAPVTIVSAEILQVAARA